jgi:hypothetical protein
MLVALGPVPAVLLATMLAVAAANPLASDLRGILDATVRADTPLDPVDRDVGTPAGWRMQDRFSGLRFELAMHLPESAAGAAGAGPLIRAMVAEADRLYGFGWVKELGWDRGPSSAGGDASAHGAGRPTTLVGEFRGSKRAGPAFVEWLRRAPDIDGNVRVKEYEDTKIRYHFTHFRVLPRDDGSVTCFPEPPFACKEARRAGAPRAGAPRAPTESPDGATRRSEL